MIWNRFEADRVALGTQYTEEHWDEGSGLSPEALRTELLAIERDMAGQPAIAVKTRLYEKVKRYWYAPGWTWTGGTFSPRS